jgi:hypothetical protein
MSSTRDDLAPATVIPTEVTMHGHHTSVGKEASVSTFQGNQHVLSPPSVHNVGITVSVSTAPSYC